MHHNLNKLKTPNKVNYQLDANLRSQNSLAFPALDSRPPLRNGGFLFFEDGNDNEAYPPATLLIATARDDHVYPFWMANPRPQSYAKFRKRNNESRTWKTRTSPATGCFLTAVLPEQSSNQTESPLRSHLPNVSPSNGSCTIGNGTRLLYVETGILTANNPATVVEGLEFDLYSAVAAAKHGISAVINFDVRDLA